MRLYPARAALAVVLGAAVLSCKDSPTSVKTPRAASLDVTAAAVVRPQIVISQIYGGGGNSGATLKNDFIEIFNPGGQAVSTAGWSVQYASATGITWQITKLAGQTIPAGGYYLVQEAAGANNAASPLPDPVDAFGTIAMSATAGKVALVSSTTALSGACPTAVDFVSFGATASDCGKKTTATLSNTIAAIRGNDGCAYSGDLSVDFAVAPPTPRNGKSLRHVCPGQIPVGPLDHVVLAGPKRVIPGTTAQFSATPQDTLNQTVSDGVTITVWSSSNEQVATVDGSGNVTGLRDSEDSVTITATAQQGVVVTTGSFKIAVKTPTIGWIDVSSSSSSFPVGFQTQLFATARTSPDGDIVPANFTFEAVDPEIAVANVANTAILTGVPVPNGIAKPGIRITATPKVANGAAPYSFVSHPITIEAPLFAPTSIYATNDEFGDPTPANTSNPNDLLIERPQYTLSYNESRGTPNWVAYELDARQIVTGQDRCNCFTADPALPSEKQIFTSDYTNGGFDRGHMARSFDRTAANGDNASTFYLTNIVPQMADLNQGVWAQFENALGDSATKGGRTVYIITGPLYSRSHGLTFVKNEGKVAVPDSTWKIALIGPRTGGNPFTRGNVQSWDDLAGLTILAVNMPNVAGVRNDPWSKYLTTAREIEQATGYNFLTLLDAAFRGALEVNDHAPAAQYAVNGRRAEGSSLAFDASASSDPDEGRADLGRDEALSYRWQFSDNGTATGRTATHTFAKYGSYTATLTVTDAFGWPSTFTQTLKIDDVAPVVSALRDSTLIAGETYSAAGSFADPGLETWSATVDYDVGHGTGAEVLPLVGKSFAIAHTYASAGTYKLMVSVSDDGGATGSSSATITAITPLTATRGLAQQVQILAEAGTIAAQQVQPLLASLDAASKQILRGNNVPAVNELGAFVNKLTAAVLSGRMSPDAAQQLTEMAIRIERVLGP